MKAALYARVSTGDQDPEMQLRELREYAERRGWEAEEYVDQAVSGAKKSRPALDELMAAARRRKLDAVAVWRFDRFARSTVQLILALDEFRALGVDFVSLRESIDTSTPIGRAVFSVSDISGAKPPRLDFPRTNGDPHRLVPVGRGTSYIC